MSQLFRGFVAQLRKLWAYVFPSANTSIEETGKDQGDRWSRLQSTVEEKIDPTNDYFDTVIRVANTLWTADQRKQAEADTRAGNKSSIFYRILMDDYNMLEHFAQTDSHRHWIVRSHEKLAKFLPDVTAEQASVHDLSKYCIDETIGYTLRWVHQREGPAWNSALDHHYRVQPHHPQYWTLNKEGDGNMSESALQESLLDMVGCRWERQLEGRADVTYKELVDFEPKYLLRYTQQDKAKVQALIDKIAAADSSE